jgi:hypothetical protein
MSVSDASMFVIDDSRVMLPIVASLTDDSRGVIYNCNMFIVQAAEQMEHWVFMWYKNKLIEGSSEKVDRQIF